jgi:hypothetical protein
MLTGEQLDVIRDLVAAVTEAQAPGAREINLAHEIALVAKRLSAAEWREVRYQLEQQATWAGVRRRTG